MRVFALICRRRASADFALSLSCIGNRDLCVPVFFRACWLGNMAHILAFLVTDIEARSRQSPTNG